MADAIGALGLGAISTEKPGNGLELVTVEQSREMREIREENRSLQQKLEEAAEKREVLCIDRADSSSGDHRAQPPSACYKNINHINN